MKFKDLDKKIQDDIVKTIISEEEERDNEEGYFEEVYDENEFIKKLENGEYRDFIIIKDEYGITQWRFDNK